MNDNFQFGNSLGQFAHIEMEHAKVREAGDIILVVFAEVFPGMRDGCQKAAFRFCKLPGMVKGITEIIEAVAIIEAGFGRIPFCLFKCGTGISEGFEVITCYTKVKME